MTPADGVLGRVVLLADERSISRISSGSSMSRAWAAKMAPYCLPSFSLMASADWRGRRRRRRRGPRAGGRSRSRSIALVDELRGMRMPSVSSTRAGPMATPGETGMPRLISMSRQRGIAEIERSDERTLDAPFHGNLDSFAAPSALPARLDHSGS